MKPLLLFLLLYSSSSMAFVSTLCDDIDEYKYFHEPKYTKSEFSTPVLVLIDVSIPLKIMAENALDLSASIFFLDSEDKVLNEVYFDPRIKDNLIEFSLSASYPKTAKAVFGIRLYTGGCSVDLRGEYQFNKTRNEMDGSVEPPIR